jgi:hypothetical protein
MVGPMRDGTRGRAGGSGPGTKSCLELVAAAATATQVGQDLIAAV